MFKYFISFTELKTAPCFLLVTFALFCESFAKKTDKLFKELIFSLPFRGKKFSTPYIF